MKILNERNILVFGVILIALSIIHVSFIVAIQIDDPYRQGRRIGKCRPINVNCEKILAASQVERAIALSSRYLIMNQREAGNFIHEYNWMGRYAYETDDPVRQADALWGLSLAYQFTGDLKIAASIHRGLTFFREISVVSDDGRRWIQYPGETRGSTGTVALVSLAIIDLLRVPGGLAPGQRMVLDRELTGYLMLLFSAMTEKGQFHKYYDLKTGDPYGGPSPYADGEVMLAMIKAAKYLGRENLVPVIRKAAVSTYNENVGKALKRNPDSTKTIQYFQWAALSYYEMATSDWTGMERYGDIAIKLSDWMINTHCTLERRNSNAYALVGIAHACELARIRGDVEHMKKFVCVIDFGIMRLISWQIGGHVQDRFLLDNRTDDIKALGGALQKVGDDFVRIDITKQFLHAAIAARKFCYRQ